MATNFPNSLDSIDSARSSESTLSNTAHDALHKNVDDAILALETKVGANYSSTVSSLDYLTRNVIHPNYFFHGFAGNQIVGDPNFYDISGFNKGAFGANLSNSAAWTNTGYVSSVAPSGGNNDGAIRMPAINFDYQAGQKLILWWLGKVTAPGATASFMGDGFGTTYPGTRIRALTSGAFDIALSSTTAQAFIGASTGTPFDGTLHSFAFMFDGTNKQYGLWVDEAYDSGLLGAYASFNSGTLVDTRSTNTFNIGQSPPAVANSTDGIASQTRAIAVFRLSASSPTPSIPVLTSVFTQLRTTPYLLVKAGAF